MKKNDISSRSSLQNLLVDSDHYLALALLDLSQRASSKNLVAHFQNTALSALQLMVTHLWTDLLGPGRTSVENKRVAAVVVPVADAKRKFWRSSAMARSVVMWPMSFAMTALCIGV